MFTRLYLHIPFCRRKCPYCAFTSRTGSPTEIDRYVQTLHREMCLAQATAGQHGKVDSVYFGGGTPSLLHPEQVRGLLARAEALFGPLDMAEITLEANPGTVDAERLREYRSAGINRLSLGIQSFQAPLLRELGRIHTAQQARDAFAAARDSGFGTISIDLINALPGQTGEMWSADLEQARALQPEHISVYGLTVEPGTPFAVRYADDSLLPEPDTAADMFEMADARLTACGYEHYEIASYARPGFRARHNCGYWQRDGYLGLGPGAHSFLRSGAGGIRFSNTADPAEYCREIDRGCLPRRDMHELTQEDAMAEFMFLGLRLSDGVRPADFEQQFGRPLPEVYGPQIDRLERLGLLMIEAQHLRLTPRGCLLSNQVFSRFLP